jgi:hypothetical protein
VPEHDPNTDVASQCLGYSLLTKSFVYPHKKKKKTRLGHTMYPDTRERELTTRQAALVDSAFEEGQYESGITMLEQLCSPTDYPSK